MSNKAPGKNPYELPFEFILLAVFLLISIAFANLIFFHSPFITSVGSITSDFLMYGVILAFSTACVLLVIMTRQRMLAEFKASQEKLTLTQMYEERFRLTIDNAPIGMAIMTPDGQFLRVNQVLCEMLGYTPDELLSIDFWHLPHPDDQNSDCTLLEKLLRGDIPRYQIGKRYARKDGTLIEAMLSVSVVRDPQGNPVHLVAQLEDVTERNRAREALATEKERLAVTLRSIHEAVITTDREGRIVLMNQVAETLTGWAEEGALGKSLSEVLGGLDGKVWKDPVGEVLRTGKPIEFGGDTVVAAPDGGERIVEGNVAPIYENGDIIGVILVFRDITERKRAEEQIRYLSFHDKLTGLYNRAYFEQELRRLDTERELPLSLIIGDLNGLKLINDAFGHHEGDGLLRKVARALQNSCRKEDIVARWGGDEFAVLLPRTSKNVALDVCERIRKACSEIDDEPIQPSIALGTATKEETAQSIYEVLKEAEDWMYRKKLMEGKSVRSSIISSLRKTLGERTYETEEHAWRLQALSQQLGRVLGLPDSQIDELALLAVLHDIGKVAIPDNILTKPGALSRREEEIMRKHPEIGYRIAASSYELAHIAEAILYHHEWWDGSGYPQGLKGEQIPLISRIIAIVDAYDVMTHGRPYKKPVSREEALEELRRCAGKQFDPRLVEIFIDMISKSEPQLLEQCANS